MDQPTLSWDPETASTRFLVTKLLLAFLTYTRLHSYLLQVPTMQRRHPQPPMNLRARNDRAIAVYDPRRVVGRRPPEWWDEEIVNLLTILAEWIAGKTLLFILLVILKLVFGLLRGLLHEQY